MGIKGTMPGLGHAPVGLPHAHQRPHEERGAEPDERVGAQARAALAELALGPDQAGEAEGQRQVGQLRPALAGRLAERGAEHHASYMPAGGGF